MVHNVAKLRLTKKLAEQRIHEGAKTSFNILLTRHAKERMSERDIVRQDVDRALQGGCVVGEPEPANEGEWKCKIVLPIKGRSRDLGVVVILRPDGRLAVKTVEWEDQK